MSTPWIISHTQISPFFTSLNKQNVNMNDLQRKFFFLSAQITASNASRLDLIDVSVSVPRVPLESEI